jgi:hypothetical protein
MAEDGMELQERLQDYEYDVFGLGYSMDNQDQPQQDTEEAPYADDEHHDIEPCTTTGCQEPAEATCKICHIGYCSKCT